MFSKIAQSLLCNFKWLIFKKPLQRCIKSPHKRRKKLLTFNQSAKFSLRTNDNEVIIHKRFSAQNWEKPINVMFFGTDEFALESLKALLRQQERGMIGELHVVTVFQTGHLHAVAKYCKENAVQHSPWPVSPTIKGYEMGIVVSFGFLIPKTIIDSFTLGMLNVHGSLLPRWRGAAPIIHAVLNEDCSTGITVMKIHPHRFDVGEVVCTRSMRINCHTKSGELTKEMAILGASCLTYCLENLQTLLMAAQPQSMVGVTKAPKIKDDDSKVVWEYMTVQLIKQMFRAYDDYTPLWTTWQDIPVKLKELILDPKNNSNSSNVPVDSKEHVFNATKCPDVNFKSPVHNLDIYQYIKKIRLLTKAEKNLIEDNLSNKNSNVKVCGRIIYCKNTRVIRIYCLDGFVEFRKVLVKGRKAMSAADFYNGFVSKMPGEKRYFY